MPMVQANGAGAWTAVGNERDKANEGVSKQSAGRAGLGNRGSYGEKNIQQAPLIIIFFFT